MVNFLRFFGTDGRGCNFDATTIVAVWCKATAVTGTNPSEFRIDACGAWICFAAYGKGGDYGWEIDHICPVAHRGDDRLSNLQPLQWQNNRHKSDSFPTWSCAQSARS
jgi:hypothetical protein